MGSQSDHRFVMVFDNTKGYVIGAALANPSSLQANLVTAIFRDENGTLIMQDTFAMKALAHLAFAFPDRYPLTAGKKGTVEFQSTGFLSGLGLRFNATGPFTSFNVLSNVGW
jgi:hypothetical protein